MTIIIIIITIIMIMLIIIIIIIITIKCTNYTHYQAISGTIFCKKTVLSSFIKAP